MQEYVPFGIVQQGHPRVRQIVADIRIVAAFDVAIYVDMTNCVCSFLCSWFSCVHQSLWLYSLESWWIYVSIQNKVTFKTNWMVCILMVWSAIWIIMCEWVLQKPSSSLHNNAHKLEALVSAKRCAPYLHSTAFRIPLIQVLCNAFTVWVNIDIYRVSKKNLTPFIFKLAASRQFPCIQPTGRW